MLEPKPEAVVQSGRPIVQATCDYRGDHGLLPEKMEDMIPAYLPKLPDREWQWDLYMAQLVRRGGQPHSYMRYHFVGAYADQWQYYPDSADQHGRLTIPGPVVKKSSLSQGALKTATWN